MFPVYRQIGHYTSVIYFKFLLHKVSLTFLYLFFSMKPWNAWEINAPTQTHIQQVAHMQVQKQAQHPLQISGIASIE